MGGRLSGHGRRLGKLVIDWYVGTYAAVTN